MDEEIKKEALDILLGSTRLMIKYRNKSDTIIFDYLKRFSSYSWINRKILLEKVHEIIHFEKTFLTEKELEMWEFFIDELTGQSFSENLKRYVSMNFLTDYFDDGDEHSYEFIDNKFKELVNEILEKPELLDQEYSWLLKGNATRGAKFGEILGQSDKKNILLNRLIEEQIKYGEIGGSFVLAGYFKALYERELEEWIRQIENDLYNRQGKAITNFEITLPAPQSDLARQTLKGPYIFDFLSIGEKASERELEKALLTHIKDFLLKGFLIRN